MKKLFAISAVALRHNRIETNVLIFDDFASTEEAEGYALNYIKELIFPLNDGWHSHLVRACEILPETILYAGYKAE